MKPREAMDFCIQHCKHCYTERLGWNMNRVCCAKNDDKWLADEVPCEHYEERED